MGHVSRLRIAGVLLGVLGAVYLVLAITVIDYQPPGLGPILASVMVIVGLFGLFAAWRIVRAARERTLALSAAAVLGGLPLAALAFGLFTWAAQQEGFERTQSEPGLSYAAPGPLVDVVVVPGLLVLVAIVAIVAILTSRSAADADKGHANR